MYSETYKMELWVPIVKELQKKMRDTQVEEEIIVFLNFIHIIVQFTNLSLDKGKKRKYNQTYQVPYKSLIDYCRAFKLFGDIYGKGIFEY